MLFSLVYGVMGDGILLELLLEKCYLLSNRSSQEQPFLLYLVMYGYLPSSSFLVLIMLLLGHILTDWFYLGVDNHFPF